MKTLADLFLRELAEMYDAEERLIKELPKMVDAATCPDLRAAIRAHLEETDGHVIKLELVFEAFDEDPQGKTCEATVGLLKESDGMVGEFKDSPAINAAIISAAQKIAHYMIAGYGCLHGWAGLLEKEHAADLLSEILAEAKAVNELLSALATDGNEEQSLGEEPTKDSKNAPRNGITKFQRGTKPVSSITLRADESFRGSDINRKDHRWKSLH